MKFIDPRIDFAFKKIFGSEDTKDILISFLESLLGLVDDKCIKEITILDPYLAPKVKGMKESVLDIRCLDHRGISYIVEMQVRKVRAFLQRIQFNAAKTYVNQIVGAEEYPKLNQVIAITITDFSLFDHFSHCVSCHRTLEESTSQNYLDGIVYYFIELSKFQQSLEKLDNVLDKWIFFIKTARSLEEVPEIFNSEPFRHAFEKARVANMDREEFELYERAGMAITDARGSIELAMEEGRHKGRQEGRQEESAELLVTLLKKRFGQLSAPVCQKIIQTDLATLKRWILRVLDAKSLDDVFLE